MLPEVKFQGKSVIGQRAVICGRRFALPCLCLSVSVWRGVMEGLAGDEVIHHSEDLYSREIEGELVLS